MVVHQLSKIDQTNKYRQLIKDHIDDSEKKYKYYWSPLDYYYYFDWRQQKIDPDNRRYPFCLVWTPIPLVSWIFPPLGHLAIGRSDGVVRDFARPYRVGCDSKKYGRRLRILQLNPELALNGVHGWDDGIDKAAHYFCKKPHLILWSNCMSFVVTALNNMQYNGRTNYKETEITWFFYNHSVYLDNRAFIKTWLPFVLWVIMLMIYIYISYF